MIYNTVLKKSIIVYTVFFVLSSSLHSLARAEDESMLYYLESLKDETLPYYAANHLEEVTGNLQTFSKNFILFRISFRISAPMIFCFSDSRLSIFSNHLLNFPISIRASSAIFLSAILK